MWQTFILLMLSLFHNLKLQLTSYKDSRGSRKVVETVKNMLVDAELIVWQRSLVNLKVAGKWWKWRQITTRGSHLCDVFIGAFTFLFSEWALISIRNLITAASVHVARRSHFVVGVLVHSCRLREKGAVSRVLYSYFAWTLICCVPWKQLVRFAITFVNTCS